jgi:hypothetical protein
MKIGQISFLRLLRVDEGRRVVAEHAEEPIDVQVDGGRLDIGRVEGIDDDPSRGDLLTDGAVAENHGIGPYQRGSGHRGLRCPA